MTVTDLQQSSLDDSSGHRSTGDLDQSSATKTTLDSQTRKTAAEDTATSAGTDEFDVYTIEAALPHVEWERIEESLRVSAGEQQKRWVRCALVIHKSELVAYSRYEANE